MKKSIWIITLVAFLAASSLGQDISNYPDNSSLGYKCSIMGNFDNLDPQDEIIVDFGSAGVWYYDGGHWYSQSSLNPETMISVLAGGVNDEDAVFDFGTAGLWYWDLGAWTQLSVANAQGMFAVDDDFDSRQEVQVDFGALGVWRYDRDDLSWTQLSGLDPYNGLRTDLGEAGHEEGCWSFPGVGVWTITKSATSDTWYYEQLTGTENADEDRASAHFTDAAGAEDLVADFGSLGLWLCKGSDKSWLKISPMSAKLIKEVQFADDAAAELLAEDENGGLYMGNWNGDGFNWTLITSRADRLELSGARDVRSGRHRRWRRGNHDPPGFGRGLDLRLFCRRQSEPVHQRRLHSAVPPSRAIIMAGVVIPLWPSPSARARPHPASGCTKRM